MSTILQTKDLTKKFGDFTANDKINLTVEEGEIKAIVGENGAGKSTLMNMLYRQLHPTSGEIFLRGQPIAFHSPRDAIQHGIGMVHQQRAGGAVTLNDIVKPLRQTGLDEDFGDLQRAERRVFRGLEHHCIA